MMAPLPQANERPTPQDEGSPGPATPNVHAVVVMPTFLSRAAIGLFSIGPTYQVALTGKVQGSASLFEALLQVVEPPFTTPGPLIVIEAFPFAALRGPTYLPV